MRITIGFDPVFFRLGSFSLGWHGLLTAIALGAALWLGMRLARRAGYEEGAISSVMWWSVAGGLVGARLFFYLDHLSQLRENPADLLAIWKGGIAVYGSFLGGVAAGYLRSRRLRLNPWPLLDAAAPAMLLGQAIGRVGCFINGDAWGASTGHSWGVVYTNPNDLIPGDLLGVATHPYPLYEIGWDLLVLLTVALLWQRLGRPGNRFLFAAVGYGIGRLWLTSFRQEPVLLLGMQEAQVIALITGAVAAVWLFLRSRHRASAVAGGCHPRIDAAGVS